ncbi:cytochrome P450 [Novosphingobium malaysiense]|uniref:Cytochrome P450 n=1 Tax=Novosphingobium malaysiense TaxID=1348853 RepID=A0A0B1ZUR4_9SPHN|nr:cytochrome P450 [Novosphingobium malaysiense]KHK93174.1 hypothetical protein LK12_02225 [Novosphingobium malaysiense]
MTNFETADVFKDLDVNDDPYSYFEYLRGKGPVTPLALRNVVAVTGYDEGVAIFRDDENFSAIDSTTGPFLPLDYDPSLDIDDQIARCRQENPFANTIINQDLPDHNRSKAILNGIITPARLKENEAFMHTLSDQIIDEFIDRGTFDAVSEYGQPFAQLVIADLLGVPKEDHGQFRDMIGDPAQLPGALGGDFDFSKNPFVGIATYFATYIQERRANPRGDVLTRLAQQTADDGSLPDVMEVVAVATFLFGAGQDTTVQLFTGMMRYLAENPGLEDRLRENPALIPDLVEEVLRLQGTVKSTFRYVRRPVTVGGVDLEPGMHVMINLAAMNRDPKRFPDPTTFDIERKNVRSHVSFGRGIHACAGGPLARAEARVTMERLLPRIRNIRLNEAKHGPAGARHFDYLPNYSLRGVSEMQVEFDRID